MLNEQNYYAIRFNVWRLWFAFALLAILFAVAGIRAFYLQVFESVFLTTKGESRYTRVLEIPGTRGAIVDRRGRALAASDAVRSVWAIPGDVRLSEPQLNDLARLLDMSQQDIKVLAADDKRDFVYLKRYVSIELGARVADLGIPGIHQHAETLRFYPAREAMAHVVGVANLDNVGVQGAERAFDDRLRAKNGTRRVVKDRLGRIVEELEGLAPAREGQTVQITLDAELQMAIHYALSHVIRQAELRSAGIIVLDIPTGAILALANFPTFDPNDTTQRLAEGARNKVALDLFEPHAALIPLVLAAALDSQKLDRSSIVSTTSGQIAIGGVLFQDDATHGAIPVNRIVAARSRVAGIKIGLLLSSNYLHGFLRGAGLSEPTGTGFYGETSGTLSSHRNWYLIDHARAAIGEGFSISLLQLARAYGAIAADGQLPTISLAANRGKPVQRTLVSAQTAKVIREMLVDSANLDGFNSPAEGRAYLVAGFRAHAVEKPAGVDGAASDISIGVAMAPAEAPRVLVATMLQGSAPDRGRRSSYNTAEILGRITDLSLQAQVKREKP